MGSTGPRLNFLGPYLSQHGPTSRTSMVAYSAAGHSAAAASASSFEQSSMKKPPTISFASANGPSTKLRCRCASNARAFRGRPQRFVELADAARLQALAELRHAIEQHLAVRHGARLALPRGLITNSM